MSGELVVVSTPIGNMGDLSPRAIEALAQADVVLAEDTRHTGQLLKRAGVVTKRLVSLHGHNEMRRLPELLGELEAGRRLVLVADAGTPAVSDPGGRLIRAAAEAGAVVTAVPGPSAVLAALVVSGMGGGRFCFEGFLERAGVARAGQLARVAASSCPSVIFESPLRTLAALSDLRDACGPEREVSVSRELTKLYEETWRGSLGEAAGHFSGGAPRGEIVVVVGASPPADPEAQRPGDEVLLAEVAALVAAGQSRRDAAGAVAKEHGLRRRVVYELATGPGRPGPDDSAESSRWRKAQPGEDGPGCGAQGGCGEAR
ncbi:MAG: 16S rRNA (cytidine(1402)-2'-O)-methyltransferase [Acidimicrobiales bacterium]